MPTRRSSLALGVAAVLTPGASADEVVATMRRVIDHVPRLSRSADPLERLTNLLALLLETRTPLTLDEIADALDGQYPTGDAARRAAFERDKAMLRDERHADRDAVLGGDRAGHTGYRIDRHRYELDLRSHAGGDAGPAARRRRRAPRRPHGATTRCSKLGADRGGVARAARCWRCRRSRRCRRLFDAATARATVHFRYDGARPRASTLTGCSPADGFWYRRRPRPRAGRAAHVPRRPHRGRRSPWATPARSICPPIWTWPRRWATQRRSVACPPTRSSPSARSAPRKVVQEVGADAVAARREDGTVVVHVPCTNSDAFRSWVLGLLDDAEVLSPPEARAAIATWLDSRGRRRAMTAAAAPRRGPRPAQERLRRLLVMLPWLMERGDVPVAEVAERFDVSEAHLVRDLEVASMCGLPPYVDEMIDLYIEDGVVHVGVPRLFTRPFRLSAPEGFSLLTAGRAALAAPGADPAGPLGQRARQAGHRARRRRARRRRRRRTPTEARSGAARRRSSASASPSVTTPPGEASSRSGAWIPKPSSPSGASGMSWPTTRCPARSGRSGSTGSKPRPATGEHFDHREIDVSKRVWFESADATAAVLELPPSAAWVAETYPVTAVTETADGRLRVELPVMGERWLERLLLRAGPDASVVEPAAWAGVGRDAARRLLERYRDQRVT